MRKNSRHSYILFKNKTEMRIFFIVLFSMIFLLSSAVLLFETSRSNKTKAQEKAVQEEIQTLLHTPCPSDTAPPVVAQSAVQNQTAIKHTECAVKPTPDPMLFASALKKNPDVVGALIAGSYISSYVVQKNNTFYLNHGFYKEDNRAGMIFLDEHASIAGRHMLLHGHNMKDGTVFGKLKEFRNPSYFNVFPTLRFITPQSDDTYVIFSVNEFSVDSSKKDYFNMQKFDFENDQAFEQFIANIKSTSLYPIPLSVCAQDTVLTLMTCYTDQADKRISISARKMHEDETLNSFSNFFPTVHRDLYYQKNHSLLTGDDVLHIQQMLQALDYPIDELDGVYGPNTMDAVMFFQREHDISPDGVVAKTTRQRIEDAYHALEK